ncbi:uncharacterized protein LOC141647441 [Silene latifolia]|uniref:uncharacterized protein LOC141647441 n=1 Tax=Silene latifolia TaxID=37657 RepID=UPI003D76CC55
MLLGAVPLKAFSPMTMKVRDKSGRLGGLRETIRMKKGGVCKASLITDPESFQVGRLLGTYGFFNVTTYSGFTSSTFADEEDVPLFKTQDLGQGNVNIRLYQGRIIQGPFRGTSVIFKVYPGQRAGGPEADMMASNELSTHAFLQSKSRERCQNLLLLLGGFETQTGEQWLAFRDDGRYSAADYAKFASEKLARNQALEPQSFWNPFDRDQMIKRRRYFVTKILQGISGGLVYMHKHDRLHQSLGPASVVLNTTSEREAAYLIARLRDLAFSVDISYSSFEKGPGALSEGLWRRAITAGAFDPIEKRNFGIADDIYEAGLLFAYLAFIPFCEPGIMDSLSLQRLLESTFKLDLQAAREYCLADDRLLEAVKFLDLGDGAGWELLQAMLNTDYRKRPIAAAVQSHRFVRGAVL